MSESYALLFALLLPLIGAVLLWIIAPAGRDAVRYTALGVSLVTLLAAGAVVNGYVRAESIDPGTSVAITDYPWLTTGLFDIRFNIGLDGLGVWMFALSALLFVTSVLVSWEAIKDREPLFYGMLLLLEFGCLGVFTARDVILFYVFFEFTLIPLFFLIGIWGSEQRRYAAIKFFLFTLAGSLLTFLGLLAIVLWDYQSHGTLRFSIPELTQSLIERPMPANMQLWVFLALFAGFAIKVPLFPVHTWLPLAHVQAPTAGSVILAGILLKIGVYGFVRFSMAMLPEGTVTCMPWILWLSVAGIIYGALVALAQGDMKRLIAYSSVSHLGYCMLGLFALNLPGANGGLLQMINHGLSTGGLFACVGLLYERYHTREIKQLGGLARRLPILAFFMLVFTFSSIGLPGLNGFPGEFLVLLGMFQRGWQDFKLSEQTMTLLIAILAMSGVVLGAWYMLQLVQKIFFGPLKEPELQAEGGHEQEAISDLSLREILALAPLVVFIVWIGLRPNDFVPAMDRAVRPVVARTDAVLLRRWDESQQTADSTVHLPSPQETLARAR